MTACNGPRSTFSDKAKHKADHRWHELNGRLAAKARQHTDTFLESDLPEIIAPEPAADCTRPVKASSPKPEEPTHG